MEIGEVVDDCCRAALCATLSLARCSLGVSGGAGGPIVDIWLFLSYLLFRKSPLSPRGNRESFADVGLVGLWGHT